MFTSFLASERGCTRIRPRIATAQGKNINDVREESLNTAQTHLKRIIFNNTDTRRQAELVRLLLRSRGGALLGAENSDPELDGRLNARSGRDRSGHLVARVASRS